jgi:hypothetical protein
VDEGTRPIPTETLQLGRQDTPAWWQRFSQRRGSRAITVVSLLVFGLGTYNLLFENPYLRAHDQPSADAPAARSPRPPENFMAMRQQHMNGFSQVTYSGVAVVVPEYWGRGEVTNCGVALADTVIYPGSSGHKGCRRATDLKHSSVQFIEVEDEHSTSSQASRPRRAQPPYWIRKSSIKVIGGGYVQLASVRDLNLRVVVRSPYRPVVERLTGSLRVAPSKQFARETPTRTCCWTVGAFGGWVRSNTP